MKRSSVCRFLTPGFGSDATTVKYEGEECLPISEVKKNLEKFSCQVPEYILRAFKPHPSEELISLKKMTETVEGWKQNIAVLDFIPEDHNDDDDYDEDGSDDANEGLDDYEDNQEDEN